MFSRCLSGFNVREMISLLDELANLQLQKLVTPLDGFYM